MTDEELVNSAREGDRDAFNILVERYAKPLTMMILRMVKDAEDARDISQHVFLKAYERLPLFRNSSSFKTWLYKVAINTVTDHLRRRKPDFLTVISTTLWTPSIRLRQLATMEKEQELRIRTAVQDLPEKQRMTLQLRVYEGLITDK